MTGKKYLGEKKLDLVEASGIRVEPVSVEGQMQTYFIQSLYCNE